MGATPNLGLRWPELPSQADGPAAFQNLATDVENKMSNLQASAAWINDQTTTVYPGTQATIFSQDIAATALGWAWIDVNVGIAVWGPYGGRNPGNLVSNAGGIIYIMSNTTLLRGIRWHSRQRSEFFYVSGAVGFPLPLATTLLPLRIVMSCDGTSDATGGYAYEVSVGVTQFGAARG